MLTVKNNITKTYEISKSKFISYCFYVDNLNVAESFLKEIKEEHSKATHVCYAYKVNEHEKFDDDGEPSYTAGMPILNCIKKQNLHNVLVVSVRYFGGVKLGAGGLVRAYTKSAMAVLEKENFTNLKEVQEFEMVLNYETYNAVFLSFVNSVNYVKIVKTEFLENVKVSVYIESQHLNKFTNVFNTIELIKISDKLIKE